MEPKQFAAFKNGIFSHMQKTRISEEGSHNFDVEVNGEVIEVTFDASIKTDFFGDGFNEQMTAEDEVTILYVEVNPMGLDFTTAQIMELENEVKLNA